MVYSGSSATPNSVLSVPEVHLVKRQGKQTSSSFRVRLNPKGKQLVSVFDDIPKLEWRITSSYETTDEFSSFLRSGILTASLATCFTVIVPDSVPLMSSDAMDIVDSLAAMLGKKVEFKTPIFISASRLDTTTGITDLVSGLCTDGPPQKESAVKISSLIEYEKFIRKLNHTENSSTTALKINLTDSEKMTTVLLLRTNRENIFQLSLIASLRSRRKTAPFTSPPEDQLATKWLAPYMASNTKLMMIVLEPPPHAPTTAATRTVSENDSNLALYESLFDALEKISLTALGGDGSWVTPQIGTVYETVTESPIMQHCSDRPQTTTRLVDAPLDDEKLLEFEIENLNMQLGTSPQGTSTTATTGAAMSTPITVPSEISHSADEIAELRAKNLSLRFELDKLRLSKMPPPGNAVSNYSNHLLIELKKLRSEVEGMEIERRKFLTSKRLIDSLVEKSNKLKADCLVRDERIEKLNENERLLKLELSKMRDHCEYLLEENRSLELDRERGDTVGGGGNRRSLPRPVIATTCNTPTEPHTARVSSLYKQFLFPFRGRLEIEKIFSKLKSPGIVVGDKGSKLLTDLESRVLDLMSASEKLEVSAFCLIKDEKKNNLG